jgi:hypothetical protein
MVTLATDPAMIEYFKEYYDHPERFACYYIKRVPGNLGKTSSQPAEANHYSMVSHLGPELMQDMVVEIKGLLSRQQELKDQHSAADAKYKLLSDQKAHQLDAEGRILEANAVHSLSKWGYEDYWLIPCQESIHYKMLPDEGEEYDCIHRIGMPIELQCLLPKNGHCNCDKCIEADCMCVHEYVQGGRNFDILPYPECLLQPHKMTPITCLW